MNVKILIVEDKQDLREILHKALSKRGYQVDTASDGEAGVSKLTKNFYNLVITDLKMPRLDGIGVLKQVKLLSPETMVIIITAFGTVENAVCAVKQGAFDYILKPFSPDEIELKIKAALEQQRKTSKKHSVKISAQAISRPIIGSSAAMKKVFELIKKVAPTVAPVLITGKSGTGKELAARELHKLSDRASGPFVAINCVALASGVLESELFGHEKGAFTGADKLHRGKFEIANGGTLFLDEIGELNENIQIKLLRFLQEKNFQRVGSNENIQVNVRIIAATNRDLKKRINEGKFREDLFYRLNMFAVALPSLQEHISDLNELAEHFLAKHNQELNKNVRISPEVIALLKNHSWPGNIRELENVIAQAIILADDETITAKHLPAGLAGEFSELSIEDIAEPKKTSIGSQLDAIESEVIRKALEETKWNQTKTAKKLGLKRTSLQYKMHKYGLVAPNKQV